MATGKTKAPPEDYDQPDEGDCGSNRRCPGCQRPLSRYNPNDYCYACLEKDFKLLLNQPPPKERKPYTRQYTKFMKNK